MALTPAGSCKVHSYGGFHLQSAKVVIDKALDGSCQAVHVQPFQNCVVPAELNGVLDGNHARHIDKQYMCSRSVLVLTCWSLLGF